MRLEREQADRGSAESSRRTSPLQLADSSRSESLPHGAPAPNEPPLPEPVRPPEPPYPEAPHAPELSEQEGKAPTDGGLKQSRRSCSESSARSTYPENKGTYWCRSCRRKHWKHSIVGQAHYWFRFASYRGKP